MSPYELEAAEDKDIVALFSTPLGRAVLDRWVEDYVFVENLRGDLAVEGARSFVLRLFELVRQTGQPDAQEVTDV